MDTFQEELKNISVAVFFHWAVYFCISVKITFTEKCIPLEYILKKNIVKETLDYNRH